MNSSINHISIFPTILTVVKCRRFWTIKDDLIKWIYEYKNNDSGVLVSNKRGWHSTFDILKGDYTFKKYLNYIIENLQCPSEFQILNYWININPPGSFNLTHVHSNCDLSGVLWIKCSDKSGKIVFENQNDHSQYNYINSLPKEFSEFHNLFHNYEIMPKEGLMCIFPSNTPHYVDLNESTSDRISISFNLKLL